MLGPFSYWVPRHSWGTNWIDYLELYSTQRVSTNLIISFSLPPSGMSFVPAGTFTMGDSLDGESDALHSNIFVSALYMDTNLVSYSQWQQIYNWATKSNSNQYGFDNACIGRATNQPVVDVDWYDCVKWCNARSQQAGLTPAYYTDIALTQIYTNGDPKTVYTNWSANGYR